MSPVVTYTAANGEQRRIPHADPRNAEAQKARLEQILEPCIAALVAGYPSVGNRGVHE